MSSEYKQSSLVFVDSGIYPTRSGNHVQPWIDGEPAFRRICQAIEAAQNSVWVTITFMWSSFQMPDGRGSALDVLESAAHRGIDVRLIFWRPDEETASLRTNAFWGSADHFQMLAQHYPHLKIRWDRAQPGYCQHQKSWLIDANYETATAFVGGINLNPHSLVMPGHSGEGHNHDVYVELTGPAVADVQHNFAQRWNEASERTAIDGLWGLGSEDDLAFPIQIPSDRGIAFVQIQRTTHPRRYFNNHIPPGGSYFDCSAGEKTNLDQYCQAIRSARRTIYLENQYLEVPEIVAALDDALRRGIEVILLLPTITQLSTLAGITAERQAFLVQRARLASYKNFTLCGIAGLDKDGERKPVHVHAKLMLIDDEWATIGSCNLHHYSLFGNGELNVAFGDTATVRAMRIELFREHLATDTSLLDDVAALRLFRRIAKENRERHKHADSNWQGLAFCMDMTIYGQQPQFR